MFCNQASAACRFSQFWYTGLRVLGSLHTHRQFLIRRLISLFLLLDCVDCKSMQSPTSSRFAMPLTTLGIKKYYIGIFFKANWARSAQYCRYLGMHLASDNTEEEQNNIEDHIQSLGKLGVNQRVLFTTFNFCRSWL